MAALLPEHPIAMDTDRGIITLKGYRFWLAKAHDFVSYARVLEELMGKGATAPLYQEGEQVARGYAETIRAVMEPRLRGAELRDAYDAYLDFFRLIGYGRFELVHWDDKMVRIRLHDGIAAEAWGSSNHMACASLAGLLATLLDEARKGRGSGPDLHGREIRCAATGAEYCEFVIEPES